MPEPPSFLSSWVFDPPVAYPAIGGVVVGLVLALVAWRLRRRPVSVWLCAAAVLGVVAGATALVLSVAVVSPRGVTAYAAAVAGLSAALAGLLTAALLFSEARRPVFVVGQALGRRGQVYQAVPGRGAGVGRVRVTAAGRSVLLSAVSAGPDLPRYTFVRVCSGQPDGRVVVEAYDGTA